MEKTKLTPLYRAVVVIGRFQLLHNGHMTLLNYARQLSHDNVIVAACRDQIARSQRCPFTSSEVAEMMPDFVTKIYTVLDVPDYDDIWGSMIRKPLRTSFLSSQPYAVLSGCKENSDYSDVFKNFSEDYLKYFQMPCGLGVQLNASDLREDYFLRDKLQYNNVPENTAKFLTNFYYNKLDFNDAKKAFQGEGEEK